MSNLLLQLRQQMKSHSVDAFLQPVHDEYMSEYPPACNQRVGFLCGFTGSAGMAVVLANKAALFVDGRYTLQAAKEVNAADYEILDSGSVSPEQWLAEQLSPGQAIGYDARLHSSSAIRRMQATLDKKGIVMQGVANMVDAIWIDRPAAPMSPIYPHGVEYTGEVSAAKRAPIAEKLRAEKADTAIITAPDSVCWLLNIRASDVENTPLALATAIINAQGQVALYVAANRVDAKLRDHLGRDVEVRAPEKLAGDIAQLRGNVLLDPASASVWFLHAVKEAGAQVVEAEDPCLLPKACKNKVELEGIRNAHIRDGAAIVKLLHWLDSAKDVTEIEVADKLLAFRKEQKLFSEPSFPTIAGSGPNGAIVHYRADAKSNRTLKYGELFLLDSGGQYHDGTTDITRTVPIGTPSAEHIDRFTRVLRGHIAIATAQFPEGTSGSQLDAFARQFLWQARLDYEHGTGHGVGQFLGVHEGPQRISKRGGDVRLQPGMILSNEPGYYKTGSYGIRIENLVAVEANGKGENGKPYYGFATLTCAPIDTRLVKADMLTADEKEWLNLYHAWVREELSPLLDDAQRAWLATRCTPLK